MSRRSKSRDQWQEVVHRYEHRRVSAEVFCQQEGICQASLFRWRKVLSPSLRVAPSAVLAVNQSESCATKASPFVDLGRLDAAGCVSADRLEIRLDLGGGLSLTLRRG